MAELEFELDREISRIGVRRCQYWEQANLSL